MEYNEDGTVKREFPVKMVKGDEVVYASVESDVVQREWDGFAVEGTPEAERTVPFDPSAKSVTEVQEYLAGADEAERARVLEAERTGKARTSLLSE